MLGSQLCSISAMLHCKSMCAAPGFMSQ